MLWIGFYPNQPGTVNVSSGTLNLNGTGSTGIVGGLVLGGGGATGSPATFNQTGGLVNVGNGTIYLANEPGGVTNMAISGGTFNDGANGIIIGERDAATLTISAGAVVNFSGNVLITNNNPYPTTPANGTLNMQGGTVTQSGGSFIVDNGPGTGTYNQTGGLYICESPNGVYIGNTLAAGYSGTGSMNVSGGTFVQTTNLMQVGAGTANSVGVVTIGGGASLGGVYALASSSPTTATGAVSLLANGLLLVGSGGISQGSGTGTFNFDGGTLAANGNNANFMQGLTAAIVEEDGGVIDNRGYAITIAQDLQSGGLNPVDGGLLFEGVEPRPSAAQTPTTAARPSSAGH